MVQMRVPKISFFDGLKAQKETIFTVNYSIGSCWKTFNTYHLAMVPFIVVPAARHDSFFGGIVPFATQFLLPMIGSLIGKEINPYGAEVWNQFVSIALGIVATILSIVSMYLGFKNSDESRAIEKNIQSAISRLEDKLDDRIQEILAREHELLNAINETKSESKQKNRVTGRPKKNNQSNNQNPENKEDE